MAKQNDTGVYQLKNGFWAFRYTLTTDGIKKDVRKSKDEFGAPLKTKRDAIRARQTAIDREHDSRAPRPIVRKTIQEVYKEYCDTERKGRAYQTIRKQDSLWENHLCARFGSR